MLWQCHCHKLFLHCHCAPRHQRGLRLADLAVRRLMEVVVQLPPDADGHVRGRVVLNPVIVADQGADAAPTYMAFKFSEVDTLLGLDSLNKPV